MSDVLELEEPAIEEPIAYTDKRILSIEVDIQNGYLEIKTNDSIMEFSIEDEIGIIDPESPLLQILAETPLDINEGVLFVRNYGENIERIDIIELYKGKASIDGYYYNADDTEPDIDNSLAEYGIIDADKLPKKTIEIEVQISDDEKLEIARKQNELLEKIVKTELAAKRVAKEYKTTIDALELELNELHNDWQRPFDIEYHSVRFFIDKENKKVHYFHLTKPELIKSEPLQPPTAGEKSLFGGVEADDIEFPDFDTSEESTSEFLNEINSDSESEPNTSDEEE